MPGLDKCIIEKCQQSWEEKFLLHMKNKNNCSGLVKSVVQHFGALLPATDADGIVDALSRSWTKLGSGAEAAKKAGAGFLVIAGLKGADHHPARHNGHVAIVVDGPLYRGKYPLCYSGSTDAAQSYGTKSTGEVWNAKDRDSASIMLLSFRFAKELTARPNNTVE
jgi:hypothetical protein